MQFAARRRGKAGDRDAHRSAPAADDRRSPPQAVQAINDACEQAQLGTLGAMQLGFMMQVAPRGQAS